MTDPIACPECGGHGTETIGPLVMACGFCHGRGMVGGDYEPAEGGHQRTDGYRNALDGEAYDPAVHGPLPAVQDHPAVRTLTGCRTCLGTGEIVNVSEADREKATTIRRTPCPDCATGA